MDPIYIDDGEERNRFLIEALPNPGGDWYLVRDARGQTNERIDHGLPSPIVYFSRDLDDAKAWAEAGPIYWGAE